MLTKLGVYGEWRERRVYINLDTDTQHSVHFPIRRRTHYHYILSLTFFRGFFHSHFPDLYYRG